MSIINIKHFDKLSFVDEAKAHGFTEQQARLIANKLEEVESYKTDELATKVVLKDLELRLIKWQFGIGAAIVASIFSLLKFFH